MTKSHRLTVVLTALVFVLFALPTEAKKQKVRTFDEWLSDKKLSKKIENGFHKNQVKPLKSHGVQPPKKVGLISFMIWDVGEFKFSAMAYTYGGTYMRTSGLTPSAGNHFATKLAENSILDLKEAFQGHDMELLIPSEFADTDEKKQVYLDFELPLTGLSKATAAIVDRLTHNPELTAGANSFHAIPAHLFAMDKKARTALEELRTTMELDAVVIVCTTTRSMPKAVGIAKIEVFMFGHNPVPMPEMKIARAGWAPAVPYANGFINSVNVFIAEMKKGTIASESYEGYGDLVQAIADDMLNQFETDYAAGK